MLGFRVEAKSGRARAGRLTTPHGEIETPVFMPVGTAGAVKAVTRRDLLELDARDVEAELRPSNRGDVSSRPGADDHEVVLGIRHVRPRSAFAWAVLRTP